MTASSLQCRLREATLVALLLVGVAAGQGDGPKLERGMTPEQVKKVLGPPRHIARQIFFQRHLEQWFYDNPRSLRLEFECQRGQEAQLRTISPRTPNRN